MCSCLNGGRHCINRYSCRYAGEQLWTLDLTPLLSILIPADEHLRHLENTDHYDRHLFVWDIHRSSS